MKQFFTLLCAFLLLGSVSAQTSFFDDFESYANNAKLATSSPDWFTWSGDLASEDCVISTEQAHSGTKSAKFLASSANGGPADVVKYFGGPYEAGVFTLDFWMFVSINKGGYFNLQAEQTVGSVWAADFFFDKNGAMTVTGGSVGGQLLAGTYPVGQWFNFKLEADLTSNSWKVFINNNAVGTFANPTNKIASIDLFAYGPTGSTGQYYVDDFGYTYTPPVFPPKDAALLSITSRKLGLTGMQLPVAGSIRNTGQENITDFEVSWVDNGVTKTASVTGVNLATLDIYDFTTTETHTLEAGDQDVTFTISKVNGTATDDNPDNNVLVAPYKGYTPAPGKAVVVEEATGTWCQWCPRGAVYLDSMSHLYEGFFIGIAVHNGDPMTIDEYDAGLTSFPGFTGFPSVVMNREALMDPSAIEQPFLESIILAPPATIKNGAIFDETTGELQISVQADFSQSLLGEYRLNAVIIEDEVTGTGSGWSQANAYAGGASGPMGGYENLPSVVPASQMVYNHVARGILGTFAGLANSLPLDIAAGSKHTANFNFTLGDENDFDQVHIVGLLTGPNGEIVNASSTSIEQAVLNGYVTGTNEPILATSVEIAPNPASDISFVRLQLVESSDVSIRIFNTMGQLVATRHYGKMSGEQILPVITSDMTTGVYNLQVIAGGQTIGKKLVVNRG